MNFVKPTVALSALALGFVIVGCLKVTTSTSTSSGTDSSEIADVYDSSAVTNTPEIDTSADGGEVGSASTAPKATSPELSAAAQKVDPPKNGEEVAVLETTKGRIIFKFRPDKAPKTVDNFKKLANKKFYDTTAFHRVIPGFMIQGGCPNSKPGAKGMPGTGDPGYSIDAEFNDIKHVPGVVSMARSSDPNSAGCQFFIMVNEYPSLDGEYTAFGQVVKGQEVADAIVAEPTDTQDMPVKRMEIKTIRIQKWPVK